MHGSPARCATSVCHPPCIDSRIALGLFGQMDGSPSHMLLQRLCSKHQAYHWWLTREASAWGGAYHHHLQMVCSKFPRNLVRSIILVLPAKCKCECIAGDACGQEQQQVRHLGRVAQLRGLLLRHAMPRGGNGRKAAIIHRLHTARLGCTFSTPEWEVVCNCAAAR